MSTVDDRKKFDIEVDLTEYADDYKRNLIYDINRQREELIKLLEAPIDETNYSIDRYDSRWKVFRGDLEALASIDAFYNEYIDHL